GSVTPKPEMPSLLRQRETTRLAETLSRELNVVHVPHDLGDQVSGVYNRSIPTPTRRLAVIRNRDTFTLAPWRPALEPMLGRRVTGLVQQHRVTWVLDRGRPIPD